MMYVLEAIGILISMWAGFGILNLMALAIICKCMYGTVSVMREDRFIMAVMMLGGPFSTLLLLVAFWLA